jgi:DNA-binding transcriptional regulator YhcF (GntR family)/DNA-binding LacI/PurR family transcriptional regulator
LNTSGAFPQKSQKSTYSRIADALREEIMSGQRIVGAQLPSTNDLALQLSASPYTIHTALTKLVKEGWLERLNGTGTYVVDPGKRFVRAGIYYSVDLCSNAHPSFLRNVHTLLLEKFKQRGKETHIFIDTRPKEQAIDLFPPLEKALQERSIQCVVSLALNPVCAPALQRIKIPTAFLGLPESDHQITSNMEDFLSKSIGHLAAQGCRSVALITAIGPVLREEASAFFEAFEKTARAEGLATRAEWISKPSQHIDDYDSFGYVEFHRLWQLKEKPDALIVYPDTFVRGITAAFLEIGLAEVLSRMKLVFHRNAHIRQFCPFPVTWAVSDEEAWAEALIRVVEKQFDGEKVSPVLLPFSLEENILPVRPDETMLPSESRLHPPAEEHRAESQGH